MFFIYHNGSTKKVAEASKLLSENGLEFSVSSSFDIFDIDPGEIFVVMSTGPGQFIPIGDYNSLFDYINKL